VGGVEALTGDQRVADANERRVPGASGCGWMSGLKSAALILMCPKPRFMCGYVFPKATRLCVHHPPVRESRNCYHARSGFGEEGEAISALP